MLDKVEHRVMKYVFERCRGRKTVLMEPKDILSNVAAAGPKYDLTVKQLEIVIKNLMLDGYIEVYRGDNKGALNYVISLTQKGEAYQREIEDIKSQRIRSIGWKIVLTVIGFAVITILGWIIVL